MLLFQYVSGSYVEIRLNLRHAVLCSDVEIEVSYEENGIVVLVKTGI